GSPPHRGRISATAVARAQVRPYAAAAEQAAVGEGQLVAHALARQPAPGARVLETRPSSEDELPRVALGGLQGQGDLVVAKVRQLAHHERRPLPGRQLLDVAHDLL